MPEAQKKTKEKEKKRKKKTTKYQEKRHVTMPHASMLEKKIEATHITKSTEMITQKLV
jgi:hypothetical protein